MRITMIASFKFGSPGDHIATRTCFRPQSKQGRLMWFSQSCTCEIVAFLRAEDKSDRVCSSCGRKIRNLHQFYSFVSSALFSSENEKSESEERFKRPVQALPSNIGFFARLNSTGYKNSETCTWQRSWQRISSWPSRRTIESVGSNWSET